jgi:hypothetical protein
VGKRPGLRTRRVVETQDGTTDALLRAVGLDPAALDGGITSATPLSPEAASGPWRSRCPRVRAVEADDVRAHPDKRPQRHLGDLSSVERESVRSLLAGWTLLAEVGTSGGAS